MTIHTNDLMWASLFEANSLRPIGGFANLLSERLRSELDLAQSFRDGAVARCKATPGLNARHCAAMSVFGTLAAVTYRTGFRIDEFLAAVARQLRLDGIKLAGAIQENSGAAWR